MFKELTIEKTSLPVGWELTALRKICEVIAGQSPESKFYNTNEEGLAFYQGKKEFTDKYIGQPTKWTTKITKEAIKNDILMSVRAPVGPVNFSIQKCCIGRGLAAIRASEKIDKEYLYNFLVKFENEIEGNEGAVFNSINKSQIGAIPIPLPPLPQQKQIVAILDKTFAAIDTAIANAEQNLQNAKELRISITNNLFNSVENSDLLTVDEVTDFITDYVANGSFASLKENVSYKKEKDYAMLLRLVDHSKKYQNPFVYVDKHAFDFLKKSTVYPNDIILSNVGARLGTAFRAPDLGIPMTLGPNSILIKAKEFGDYFYCWLQSAYGQKAIKSIVSGAGQPKFNKTQFKKIKVPIPKSKDDRDNIILKINQANNSVDKLYGVYIKKIADLEEMKKSILQKAFSGQLNTLN